MSDLMDDRRSGLILPRSVFEDRHQTWLTEVMERLAAAKVEHKLEPEELGIVVRRHKKGTLRQWLVFNANETQVLPAAVFAQQLIQWANGTFEADNVYRLLSPEEQVRISRKTGRQPLKEKHNAQDYIDKQLKLREDLRRQGFDPKQEGLT